MEKDKCRSCKQSGHFEEMKEYDTKGNVKGKLILCKHCGAKKARFATNDPSGLTKKERELYRNAPKNGFGARMTPING